MYPIVDIGIKKSSSSRKFDNGLVNILCVGNIRYNKGQFYLLQAVKSIQQDIKITFVGMVKEKDYLERVNRYIIENDLSGKVQFKGFLRGVKLADEYQKADIFVSPTLKEGFGMTIYEAMSFGLPIVSSKIGSIMEQLTDGEEGFLVPSQKPEVLANKIITLIENPKLRAKMGESGQKRSSRLQTIDKVFEQFNQVLVNL